MNSYPFSIKMKISITPSYKKYKLDDMSPGYCKTSSLSYF